jgi:2-C-methyl-D-erythritol 4-phosphate cytidylyltransferase
VSENVAVIICAAGASSRFGGKRRKPFVDVGGRAVFLRSIEIFSERDDVKQILLGICPEDEEIVKVKWGANLSFFNVKIFFGGQERFETVEKGLELVRDDIDIVAVHDAVRCCLIEKWIDDCFAQAAKSDAAILASAVSATIKDVKDKYYCQDC